MVCTNFNNNYCYSFVYNQSYCPDKKVIEIQESVDDVPTEQTFHTVILFAHNGLVDEVAASGRVYVTGILGALPIQVKTRASDVEGVHKAHMDFVNFRKEDTKRNIGSSIYKNKDFDKVMLLQVFGGPNKTHHVCTLLCGDPGTS
ncbi:hypothetical protein QAD02_007498 [Eretmocerus hayati]|uniref:Uncharacterized protein n=1 Tax=Eretmocerus hayati TaxID=131215 RepID=A0ACC2N4M7_9HYME|nr:hypothetical protein QAD02_007498 [Eretmocerus hayati]